MPEPISADRAAATEARLAELRSQIRSGPVTLEQAAATLGTSEPDLMSAILVGELQKAPGAVAIITGTDGAVIVKRAGDGELSIQAPTALVQIFVAALFQNDPAARAAICAPLPAAAGSAEVQ